MKSKNKLGDDEIAIFRASVGEVKRLQTDKVLRQPPRPAAIAWQTRRDQARVMEEIFDFRIDDYDLQPGDALAYSRPGVRKTVMRKLKRGQYRIDAELDLHGLSAPRAQAALYGFMRDARAADIRCVRIIHGKGRRSSNRGPVIKPLVSAWLRRRQEVLAFCSARPVDGGTGAIYVLLTGLAPGG
ncbi:MAG: Smr/MutS family protein [Gammaproteobacteria bacterium]|nr:Smr/MutS family protein [Gammaproteobacteria bacterium]